MSIIDYLYKGAPPGAQQAAQQAAKNTSYGTIAKNIKNEGAFGFGKNLKGFDPNFKGGTNLFNYIKGGLTSVFGGNAPGNIGGGTPAQRVFYEKLASSPFGKYGGAFARSAFSLPMTAAVSGPYALYQMNKPSTPAGYDYVKEYDKGAITSAADETEALDYENFIKGMMTADKNYVAPNTTNINTLRPEDNLMTYNEHYDVAPDRDKGILSKIKDFAATIAKNVAGRTIASQALGGAGGMIFGPAGALVGGLAGLFGGGNLFNQPYRSGMNTVDEFGNLISAEELDKQNALGGYYTDAARASRSRAKSIRNMIARRDAGLNYGKNRLEKLQALQDKEDKSRQDAFNEVMSQGNNQQDFYDSLNQGSGSTAVSGNPNTSGAGDAPGYSGPTTFKYGGIVGLYR